jgi:hypothetical protein
VTTPLAPPRIDWVDRQLAAGRDFRAALAFLDARRARHLRGAHGTWGVALGFDVAGDLSASPRILAIGPGLAYDAAGRELVSDRLREVPIPPAAAGVVIATVASTGCVPDPVLRIAWSAHPLRLGHEVPLATIDLDAGTVDAVRRPHVQTMAPPRLGGGLVEVGAAPVAGASFGYDVAVDTAAAGFESVPTYLVQPVSGELSASQRMGLLGPLLTVHDPQPDRFSLTVRYLAPTGGLASAAAELTRPVHSNPFAFSWVGVEPARLAGVPSPAPAPTAIPL